MAGQMFGIPVGGTMAHSWVMYFPDELTAFSEMEKEGIPTDHIGIRLDSGDLAYLSYTITSILAQGLVSTVSALANA